MGGAFGWIAFTLLLSLPTNAASQRPDSTYRNALALELPTLPPPVAVHYSPGYGDRAAALQRGARAVRDLLRDSVGLGASEVTLLVLDSADWGEATELPYGLHTLLQDAPAFLAPAQVDRGIYHDDAVGGREAELGVDVIGLHYLAHFYAAEALYGEGYEADPPVKWLDELFTLMLQDELLRAMDPALAEAAARGEAASLRLDDPAVTTLAGFDREYRRAFVTREGADDYAWFLARLAGWAREIRVEHGLRVMGAVREALARGPAMVEPEEGLDLLARVGVDVSSAVDADGGLRSTDRCDPLRAEVSVRADLDPDGSHCYELHLERGDYALVVVRELGGDLAVAVTRPDGTEPYQRVSRFWTDGFEQVAVVARTSGSHRIEIEPARPLDRPAEYSVAVERLRSVEAQESFRRRLRADASIAWVERNSIEMRSIDMDADDFSDLAPLRQVFGDARVVMLGEQSHGDGSSNVARSRLIRYLHEELGFDVLAFEAGLYDMNRTWRAALDGRAPDPLWGGSETAPLSQYLIERLEGDRPLELMGVDPQFLPGTDRAEAFFREISDHVERTGLDAGPLADRKFREVLGAFLDGRHYLELPPAGERELLLRSLDSAAESFRRAPVPPASQVADERLFWIRVLETAGSEAESLYRAREAGDLEIHGANRDREMARNLVWIARVLRPHSRIIVWAHGFHTMRNPHRVLSTRQMDFSGAVTMGHAASEELGDAIYSLGATSYEGAHGRACRPPIEIVRDQVDEVELEELLEAAGLRHAIVDLRGSGTGAGGLVDPVFARPVGHVAELAPWGEIYDGFLFLRAMRPASCDEDE